MNQVTKLYLVTFTDGASVEEYGYSAEDVEQFCCRVYTMQTVKSVVEYKPV